MIQRLRTITSTTTVPYDNIALEAYLLHHVEPGECILYLWQNRRTVVIGRNQNCWKECRCGKLKEDGGYLARRLSGGGAVFHDLGNLNFTFLVRKEDYSVERQSEVILRAVQHYGIRAERTGRNDIVVDGRKFSGSAYYQTGDCCYHHGTILIDADKKAMSEYLNVSQEKLQSKGVDSVRSRVVNLTEYAPQMTVAGMRRRLAAAYSEVYGRKAEEILETELDREETAALKERFSSWEWLYGRKLPFTCQMERRFAWGEAELQLQVDGGVIRAVNLYSDALDTELIDRLLRALPGIQYEPDTLAEAVKGVPAGTKQQEQMKRDISTLLCESI